MLFRSIYDITNLQDLPDDETVIRPLWETFLAEVTAARHQDLKNRIAVGFEPWSAQNHAVAAIKWVQKIPDTFGKCEPDFCAGGGEFLCGVRGGTGMCKKVKRESL